MTTIANSTDCISIQDNHVKVNNEYIHLFDSEYDGQTGLYDPERNVFIFQILKNASTTLDHLLLPSFNPRIRKDKGYTDTFMQKSVWDVSPREIIIPYRDSINRWCSGIIEMLKILLPDYPYNLDINQSLIELLFHQITFKDLHTERQSWFIRNVDSSICKFIHVNSTFTVDLCNYLDIVIPPGDHHKNQTSGNEEQFKLALLEVIRRGAKKRERLQNWFKVDYEILKTYPFIN